LNALFFAHTGAYAEHIVAMPRSGSSRQYFRLQNQQHSLIGVHNEDLKENTAFVAFSASLAKAGVNVPRVLAENLERDIYLQNDLGDMTLFEYIKTCRVGGEFPDLLKVAYRKVLTQLPVIQTKAPEFIPFDKCYPRQAFDLQSMMWDLNYFKYYFLKLAGVAFDEQALEDDFRVFTDWLLKSRGDYFLYRDFQSRNVLLVDGEPYFIDYQGGRRGALQYDIASLLYDSKADLPESVRDEFLNFYLDRLQEFLPVNRTEFVQYYHGFVLIRIMQAMGAYGYRGFFERKELFLQSIPYALDNLQSLLAKIDLPIDLPELTRVWQSLANSEKLRSIGTKAQKLRVKIQSFSFRRGLPEDTTEHGGGYIFDCRSVHNPGRYPEYKTKTGKDQAIIDFFAQEEEMLLFFDDVKRMVFRSVEKYISRKFNYISVSFGCTGGQHRSVYCAEQFAKALTDKYDVVVDLSHREEKYWPS
jgi:aminoglycoside/choline kinase family phosphotransferase